MPTPGVFDGLTPGVWHDYRPRIVAVGGSPVQHIVSDERNIVGEYLITIDGMVKAFAGVTIAAGDTLPSGETFALFISLPFPAHRGAGGADLPIGTAILWQGPSADPSPLMVGQVSLADPSGSVAQGREDSFCQVFISATVARGTATIPSGSTSVTVAHGLPGTPRVEDIRVVATNNPTVNPRWRYINGVDATNFVINVNTNPSTSGATFAWAIDAVPSASLFQLMGSKRPWQLAAGHFIGLQIDYEARR